MCAQSTARPMPDHHAALCSAFLPGLGQLIRARYGTGLFCALISVVLVISSLALGRTSGRAAEIVFFMLLTLPWWAFQSYDAALGPSVTGSDFLRTSRAVWGQGHDIRFLGLLFLMSAGNDAILIAKNPDYLLPFFCMKLQDTAGVVMKALSPALHMLVGLGFLQVKKWSLLVYFVYAAYGTTNALVNLTCFGPGRIRNTLIIVLVIFTSYLTWRRRIFRL